MKMNIDKALSESARKPYGLVSRHFLEDKRLSQETKLILCYILTYNYKILDLPLNIFYNQIDHHLGFKVPTAKKAILELIKSEYIALS